MRRFFGLAGLFTAKKPIFHQLSANKVKRAREAAANRRSFHGRMELRCAGCGKTAAVLPTKSTGRQGISFFLPPF